MPGKIKVKVLAGRNLPVMDRAGDTTDAFVEIKFGGVTHKTDVCRKSLNPHWSSTEWYRFEVDESELQDEPLQLRLMDHDTYSANDAIGKVVISLAPLLAKEANNIRAPGQPGGAVMSGWIPVFDTMHGIRGELNIIVKVDLFTDFNKYKTSSCGVQFFHCHLIPHGYRAISIHGFVEELVVNDDPEYQWIDKIRTPRASNEARQVAFIKLSNQVQRLIGVKAAELGANAVVGYQQDFDLEGEAGVVARAIGTAVTLAPLSSQCQPINLPSCTQQQLRQCLDILATDGESITDLNQYFQNHQEELKKLLIIMNPKTPSLFDDPENADDDEKGFDLVRQPSCKSYADSVSIYQGDYESQKSLRHISEDQTDLNKLLKGDGNDSDSDSTSPMHKIKKIKTNFFSKKFGSNRSRKSEKQEDQVSIRSNSSDTSRLSLTDIKKEIIKFKRLKKPKFRQTFANIEDEGVGMASILARSVIHAHTSLACIAESQDSEHSPCSTMRRTSESEPTINMSDDDTGDSGQVPVVASKTETKQKTKPLQLHSSLKNIINNEVSSARRRLSQSCPSSPVTNRSKKFLTLPSGPGYFGSLSISAESSVYSSSDEDESSDQKTDTEKSIETTSIVVRSVLSGGVNHDVAASQMNTNLSKLENEKSDFKVVDPGVACLNYENDTCILENRTSDFREIDPRVNHVSDVDTSDSSSTPDHTENKRALQNTDKSSDTYVNTKPNHTLRFKLHNPFSHKKTSKCFSAPSSPIENTGFVYRSSKHIKHQLSKISNSNMIKSLSHYSLMPKKKQSEPKVALSQPGSSSNVPSRVPSETVLGSPFLSLADLQGLDKDDSIAYPPIHKNDFSEISRVKMYIGSEPVSRASISGPSFSRRISRDDSHIHEFNTLKRDRPEIKPVGLIHTAMETILMDKVQSLLVPTSPVTANNKDKKFFDDVHKKLEGVEEARKIHHIEQIKKFTTEGQKHETAAPENLLLLIKPPNNTKSTAMITENFQSLTSPRTSNTVVASERSHKCTPEHLQHCEPAMESLTSKNSTADSLINTAMKTILMDKIQALVPDSEHTETPVTEIIEISNNQSNNDIVNVSLTSKHGETESLVQTAMKTMLVDKAQALLPKCSDQMKIPVSYASDLTSQIIDSAQSKNIPPTELTNKPSNNDFDTISFTSPRSKSENLVETAMMALLIDKAQTIIPTATGQTDLPVLPELANASSPHAGDSNEDSLLYSAMETILLDKVNSMIPPTLSLKKDNKLVRQDSIHSLDGQDKDMLPDVSMNPEANIVIPCKKNHPVLQHFHPILSGAPLETIPSLPENSFEHTESLDVEGVDESSNIQLELETNSASVCDNSHAACRFDRSVVSYERSDRDRESPQHTRHESYGGREPLNPTLQQLHGGSVSSSAPVGMQRRSSDSDLSVTPKGGSLNASLNTGSGGGIFRGSLNKSNLEMLEYPFLTMTEYPHGFIKHIGGTVCARSVKLLDVGGESETRAAWWAELRTELRSHARALRCNAVIAYSEGAAICEDVCVLSAIGTAALINIDFEFSEEGDTNAGSGSKTTLDESEENSCLLAHVPYTPGTGPQSAELSTCAGCKRARVPAMLLATCVKPDQLPSYDRAINLTAVAARIRRAPPNSEPGARDISDQLPFLEYELHKLLVAKLRVQGANALFSLQTQLAIGERYVMALASGTAVKLFHLPPPTPPRVKISHNDRDTLEIQKALWDAFAANKAANGYDIAMTLPDPPANGSIIEQHELEELPVLDLCIDKDACTLDLDEAEEVESAKALTIRRTLMQVYTNDSKPAPNSPPHAFSQVWRSRLVVSSPGSGGAASAADRHVTRVMDGVVYKLRRLQPCGIVPPKLHIELPEDEIQIIVSGTAIRLDESSGAQHSAPVSEHSHETSAHSHTNSCHSNHHSSSVTTAPSSHSRSESSGESHSDSRSINQSMGGQELHRTNSGDADDDIFALDEDQCTHSAAHSHANETYDDRNIHAQIPAVVILTSLPSVNGARGSRRLCALRLLFVRETTAVRELGGVSGFLHTFTCEVLAIARAYTAALGGNAISSFYINQLILQDNAHKNQGQCLLSVGGDVEQVSF